MLQSVEVTLTSEDLLCKAGGTSVEPGATSFAMMVALALVEVKLVPPVLIAVKLVPPNLVEVKQVTQTSKMVAPAL